MKKILFLSGVLIVLTAPMCFAGGLPDEAATVFVGEKEETVGEEGVTTVKKDFTMKPVADSFMTGIVEYIDYSDLFTRPNSKITVVDEKNARIEFTVKPAVVIYDDAGKIMSLKEVSAGDKVVINYNFNSKKGIFEAFAIKVIGK